MHMYICMYVCMNECFKVCIVICMYLCSYSSHAVQNNTHIHFCVCELVHVSMYVHLRAGLCECSCNTGCLSTCAHTQYMHAQHMWTHTQHMHAPHIHVSQTKQINSLLCLKLSLYLNITHTDPFVCVCVFAHVSMCMYIRGLACMSARVARDPRAGCLCMCARMCVCVHTRVHVCVCARM
jgi:hypothetical protein